MATRSVRVDEETWEAVRQLAFDGKTTMQTVVRALVFRSNLGVSPSGLVVEKNGTGARATAGLKGSVVEKTERAAVGDPGTCPKCGCKPSCHRSGSQKNRCQAHPTCVWVDVPEDLF